MHRHRGLGIAVAALGLAVSACEQASEPPVPPVEPTAPTAEAAPVSATFVCDSGLSVAVAYPDAQSAQVTYRDRTFALRAAPAASGARYADAEMEWASLTRDGVERATLSRLVAEDAPVVLERCSRPAPAAPIAAPAPVAPVAAAPAAGAPGAQDLPPPCKGPQLRLSAEGGDAGAGNRVSIIGVQNVGARACSLTGYPAVVLQDRQGRDLTGIRAEQTLGSYFRQGQTPAPVRLEPQGKGYFDVAWNVVPNETQGQRTCPSVTRIRMTAPGDTSPVSLDQPLSPCGGRVRISPFRPVAEPAPEPAPAGKT
jgi:membrane-bound inhibitor of C-type lysozyme